MSIIKIYSYQPKDLHKQFNWTKDIYYSRLVIVDDKHIFTGLYNKYVGKKYYLSNTTVLNLLAEISYQRKKIKRQNSNCKYEISTEFNLIQEIDTDKFIKKLSGIKKEIFKNLIQNLQEK